MSGANSKSGRGRRRWMLRRRTVSRYISCIETLESPRVAEVASDEMRCENKPMHQRLNLRLKALEKWLPDETNPLFSRGSRNPGYDFYLYRALATAETFRK